MALLHENVTDAILNAFYVVYNELGYGFAEKVYEIAMAIELQALGLEVQSQYPVCVRYKGVVVGDYVADLVVTLIIAAYVLYQGFSLLPRSIRLLMHATPDSLDFDRVVAAIRRVEGVRDVHHVHLWNLGEHARALEAHVQPQGASLADFAATKVQIRAVLAREFKVKHATLEACEAGEHPNEGPLQTPHKV